MDFENKNTLKTFERIKILRILAGLTQNDLGQKLGLNQSSITRVEKSKDNKGCKLGVELLPQLSGLLQTTDNYLFDDDLVISGPQFSPGTIWWPICPDRSQILDKLIRDLKGLLPGLLYENKIDFVNSGILGDGKIYLFGSKGRFCSLLILKERLRDTVDNLLDYIFEGKESLISLTKYRTDNISIDTIKMLASDERVGKATLDVNVFADNLIKKMTQSQPVKTATVEKANLERCLFDTLIAVTNIPNANLSEIDLQTVSEISAKYLIEHNDKLYDSLQLQRDIQNLLRMPFAKI